MTKAYLNYPKPHMTLHGDVTCLEIGKMHKVGQREIKITQSSLDQALRQLANSDFKFGSEAPINDIWLIVDFNDAEFEEAVAKHIQHVIGQRYRPIKEAPIKRHCDVAQ